MLRITQSAGVEAALSYFDTGLQQGDYYANEQGIDSFWGGGLGLYWGVYSPQEKTAPTREQFERLAKNQHPVTSEKLTARNVTNRKVGYDFTFNAPKSLSIASEVLGQDAVRKAFVDSVEKTMREIETDMMARVRKNNQNSNRVTQNMVYAGFVHRTTRPVNGIADPHLHCHCFVFNATHDAVENQYKAVETGYINKNAPYYESVFHSFLAEKLVDLGYTIERNGRYVELAGIGDDLKNRYSRRMQQIEEVAKLKGITDDKDKAKLGAKTRENKSESTKDGVELIENWKSRMGFSEEKLFYPSVPIMDRKAPSVKAEVLTKAIEHIFERKSVVTDKQLLAEALRLSYGTATIEELKEQLEKRIDLLQQQEGHDKSIMAQSVLKEEQAVVDFAKRGKDYCDILSPNKVIKDKKLNDGQHRAIRDIWSSKDFITILEGGAGVGKTTLAKIAVQGIESSGQKVHMFAPSAQASRGVLRADGFKDANTVASLFFDKKKQQQLKNQVMWIDEAGLLGTPTLYKVLQIAGEQNCRVILSGDIKQHKSVERGDALSLLYDHAGIEPIQVSEIVRQRGGYKQVVKAIQNDNVQEGFGHLNLLGGIVQKEDEKSRLESINKYYVSALRDNESALIVAPTHAEKDKVTASLRSYLKDLQRLGVEEKTVPILKSKNLTKGEKQDPLLYRSGQVVQFISDTKDGQFRQHEQVAVVAPAGTDSINVVSSKGESKVLNLSDYKKFTVFEAHILDIAEGELLRATDNVSVKDKDGKKHQIHNGATYTVKKMYKSGDILLSNGWIIPKDFRHLDYGYCSTSHSSQGKTVDHVIIAESQESFGAANKEQFYVSVSRGRKSCKVFTDDKEALLRAVESTHIATNALDTWIGKHVTPSRRVQAGIIRQKFLDSMPRQTHIPTPKTPIKEEKRQENNHYQPEGVPHPLTIESAEQVLEKELHNNESTELVTYLIRYLEVHKGLQKHVQKEVDKAIEDKQHQATLQKALLSMPKSSQRNAPKAQNAKRELQEALNKWQGKEVRPSKKLRERIIELKHEIQERLQANAKQVPTLPPKKKKKQKHQNVSVSEMPEAQKQSTSPSSVKTKVNPKVEIEKELELEPDFE